MKLSISVFLSIFLISSCKKNSGNSENTTPIITYLETDVTGTLTDLTTGGPMINMPVSVYFEKENIHTGPSGGNRVQTVRTDAAGSYSLHFTREIHSEVSDFRYYYKILPDSIYGTQGYRLPLQFNNPINFSVRFYKNMNLHLKVMRHDRNHIFINLRRPPYNHIYYEFGNVYIPNPVYNLDTVFNFRYVPQGINYQLNILLANSTSYSNATDSVPYQTYFYMLNDTTIHHTIL